MSLSLFSFLPFNRSIQNTFLCYHISKYIVQQLMSYLCKKDITYNTIPHTPKRDYHFKFTLSLKMSIATPSLCCASNNPAYPVLATAIFIINDSYKSIFLFLYVIVLTNHPISTYMTIPIIISPNAINFLTLIFSSKITTPNNVI